MKIFQTSQENLSYLGISSYYLSQQYPINMRNVTVFLALSFGAILNGVNLCYVATTFEEYADSTYACWAILLCIIIFVCVIWRMRLIFDWMNRMEEITNESKYVDLNSAIQ